MINNLYLERKPSAGVVNINASKCYFKEMFDVASNNFDCDYKVNWCTYILPFIFIAFS